METRTYGHLEVAIFDSNADLGRQAADEIAEAIKTELTQKDEIAVILATGNSQYSMISELIKRSDIDWTKITVLHMDEYLGMAETHPASFRRWMNERVASQVSLKAFEGVRGDHEPASEEVARYTKLLEDLKPSICVMGIGENGHLAFNDPPAEFDTPELVKIVPMDEVSRNQQVGEGHFASISDVPTHAITLTIPALLRAAHIFVLTPEARKAQAVKRALEGPIAPDSPASILREVGHAKLFLDSESSSLLD